MLSAELIPEAPDLVQADPAAAWAASGGLWLTGRATGDPLMAGAGAGALADRLLQDIGDLVGPTTAATMPTVSVVGERAALAGLRRQGARSCGGASRMLTTADGHVVLTLARQDDLTLVPALVSGRLSGSADPWGDAATWARQLSTAEAADRIALLGLPGGAVGRGAGSSRPAVVATDGATRVPRDRPRVLDLSSLWAGPLCTQLLGLAGADVVKVESAHRLDGARRGNARFYDLLHAGHRSVVLDFDDPADLDWLHRLATAADVVIEASRPRALERLGLDAASLVAAGVTWVSITAYGRDRETADLIGFGDDVAAVAGLTGPGPVFVGDAVADPLTGLAAAAATLASLHGPCAQLLDVAMAGVAARAAALPEPVGTVCAVAGGWVFDGDTGVHRVAAPRARRARASAPAPGADNGDVLQEWLS